MFNFSFKLGFLLMLLFYGKFQLTKCQISFYLFVLEVLVLEYRAIDRPRTSGASVLILPVVRSIGRPCAIDRSDYGFLVFWNMHSIFSGLCCLALGPCFMAFF